MVSVSNCMTNAILCILGYHDDCDNNTFGKKGVYMPQSNFLFDFIDEVVCTTSPQNSGFLITVKSEGSNESRSV